MLADHRFSPAPPARSPQPSPTRVRRCLAAAIMAVAGQRGRLTRHCEQPWASATFTGCRHSITLDFAGAGEVAAAEQLIADLPDHEFAIPGQIVADATVTAVCQTSLPVPRLTLTAEILLLDDV